MGGRLVGIQREGTQSIEEGVRWRRGTPCGRGACRGTRGRRTRNRGAGAPGGTCRSGRGRRTCARPDWPHPGGAPRRRRRPTGTPPNSVSRVAWRRITVTGGSQRSASSKACGIQGAVVVEGVELGAVGQEGQQEVARGPVGRLDPGGKDQAQERVDLLVGELRSLHLDAHEVADQVVARRRSVAPPSRRRSSRRRAAERGDARAPSSPPHCSARWPTVGTAGSPPGEARGCGR